MMYAVDSTFLEYKNILEFINSAECTLLFEPKDNIYYISFRYKCDKLELQRLINEIIEQQCKQLIQDYEYYITIISDDRGLVRFYSFGHKSDKPLIANINCEYGTITTQLFNANEKSEYIFLSQFLESSNAELLVNLAYHNCDVNC